MAPKRKRDSNEHLTAPSRTHLARACKVKVGVGLLDVPGEIRNKIYDYVIADAKQHRRGQELKLKYRPIKSRKRFKTNDQWRNAHRLRPYWGLTQVCHELRFELRPMHTRAIKVDIPAELLPHYLAHLSGTDEVKALGNRMVAIINQPWPAAGLDVLPVLKDLSMHHDADAIPYLRVPPNSHGTISFRDTNKVVPIMTRRWLGSDHEHIQHDMVSAALTTDRDVSSLFPPGHSIIITLKDDTFNGLNDDGRQDYMINMIRACGLDRMHDFYIDFRCKGNLYMWGSLYYSVWAPNTPRFLYTAGDKEFVNE
ncbi:uncharacterized protein J4E92_001615 [Alternaria infectoria]|uniref:uncharacterized protein n=1 Tax=Alternaria infectoria TaxID=45303 RepID=UPI00222042F4|nr:uncharacterized protein J4E92_001615 [Alternaria infectoria]KAI4936890.1 hypothetical protein J4E92_001615 [Alternaria infectoria]